MVINSPWIFPYWIPKNWLAHKYMDCGKGSGIPYLVLSSPKVIFSPKELASPEQTATGKDNSNPFIVTDLLINQMVIKCTIVFELKHLATPVVMAIGKETSNPLVSMIHLSQELTHLEVMRIVCNEYVLMYIWSFVAAKKCCFSRWCHSWSLAFLFFVVAG